MDSSNISMMTPPTAVGGVELLLLNLGTAQFVVVKINRKLLISQISYDCEVSSYSQFVHAMVEVSSGGR